MIAPILKRPPADPKAVEFVGVVIYWQKFACMGFLVMFFRGLPSFLLFFLLLQPLASAPPPMPGDPLTGSGEVTRTSLTAAQLFSGFSYTSPENESALAVPDQAAHPSLSFEGRLELLDEATVGSYQIVRDDYDYENDPQRFHLPEFDFQFVQHGSHLIPVQRGRIVTEHPYWDYLLSPGRVWHENDDGDAMRVAIPFALLQKNQNCIHNGTLMFLFKDGDVSYVWYQITQETCPYFKTDMWGLLPAIYHQTNISDADALRSHFVQEVEARLPTKPIAALTELYPDVDLADFGSGLTPEHVSVYGLVADGVNYVGPCRTRYGEYGYCEAMRHASYSTAKSAFAAMALMRLAQRDGLGVKDLLIKDYVPEAASAGGDWDEVTFENVLDMVTGNYESDGYMEDEEGATMSAFFNAETYNAKIAAAFSYPNKAAPGQKWVYHTSDTFILARALQNYLGEDVFDWLVQQVFEPLKIGPGAHSSARTSENNWQGQAFGGYGLWWTVDDAAKLAELMQHRGRTPDGDHILHPDLVARAMQRTADRGFLTGVGEYYHLGFWTSKFTPDVDSEFLCTFYTPYMSGNGGITILMLPNGMTYYYFSDNGEFAWLDAVKATNHMRSHCLFPADIACSGDDVVLSWPTEGLHDRYRIWRSEHPDFLPGDANASMIQEIANTAENLTYTDPDHCEDSQQNYYYRIEAVDGADVRVGLTGVLGEFDFGLLAGE